MTDVVLNHTSFDNPVLKEHYDMSYNNLNTPQLIPAIELELAIARVSRSLEAEAFEINSESQLDEVIRRISLEVVEALHFDEYWLISVDSVLHELSSFFSIQSFDPSDQHTPDDVIRSLLLEALHEEHVGHRFPLSVRVEPFKRAIASHCLYRTQLERVIASLNAEIRATVVTPQISSILTSIRNGIHYRFLERRPPSPIPSLHYPLLDSYFTNITHDTSRRRSNSYNSIAGKEDADACCYCVNNGWTWDNDRDPLNLSLRTRASLVEDGIIKNYAINTKVLRREMVIWSDCVKLRYFDKDHRFTSAFSIMREYIELCALLFDGFRLDNCHNTPLALLEALVPLARAVNPRLILLAELFTQDQAVDQQYISSLGIDMIVRETVQNVSPSRDIRRYSDSLYAAGGQELGSLTGIRECPCCLVTTQLPTVLYDITHDNPTFLELYGVAAIPAVTVLNALCVTHTASTKGFDEGYPKNPSVVEKRLYAVPHEAIGDWNNDALLTLRTGLLALDKSTSIELPDNCYLRLLMNHLHQLLSLNHFHERYVHHYPSTAILSIERRYTGSFFSVVCVSHTAFTQHANSPIDITLLGRVVGVFVSVKCGSAEAIAASEEAETTLKGTPFAVDMNCRAPHSFCSMEFKPQTTTLHFNDAFTPGSSLVLLVYSGSQASFDHLLNYVECMRVLPR